MQQQQQQQLQARKWQTSQPSIGERSKEREQCVYVIDTLLHPRSRLHSRRITRH